MKQFFSSFKPIGKHLKKYKIELFLIGASFLATIISIGLFLTENNNDKKITEISLNPEKPKTILVDIAGAVFYPDVYEVTQGARLKDLLIAAGGLSAEADREFFGKNFNLAKILQDQEKIYIPSKTEIKKGVFVNNNLKTTAEIEKSELININTANIAQLETLPGVGKITAEKIIAGRPYLQIEDLLTKKIINKNVYEKIKNLISIN